MSFALPLILIKIFSSSAKFGPHTVLFEPQQRDFPIFLITRLITDGIHCLIPLNIILFQVKTKPVTSLHYLYAKPKLKKKQSHSHIVTRQEPDKQTGMAGDLRLSLY